MTPQIRKFALTVHIIVSIGWFGVVAGFLMLAIFGLISQDIQTMQAAYIANGMLTTFVIIPLCIASLLTGIVSSVSTDWGLFQHYWVLLKLLITAVSTFILFVHTQPIGMLADAARSSMLTVDLQRMQIQMVVASGATLVVLIVLTVLSVYKPRGLTPFRQRKQHHARSIPSAVDTQS